MNAGPLRRVGYSLVGLGVANAVMVAIQLARSPEMFSQLHLFPPDNQTAQILIIFAFVPAFSLLGWLAAGLPAVLMLSTKDIVGLPWLILLPGGALLGPVLIVLVILLWTRGENAALLLRTEVPAFVIAAFLSGTAFAVHCLLVRWYAFAAAPLPGGDEAVAAL